MESWNYIQATFIIWTSNPKMSFFAKTLTNSAIWAVPFKAKLILQKLTNGAKAKLRNSLNQTQP